jgi:hypothetical protein
MFDWHGSIGTMDEARKAEQPTTDEPANSGRRPWRAPQFFVAEFANTLTQANGVGDGNLVSPTSS